VSPAAAAALVLSEGAVEKHIASIFWKLNLEALAEDNRRVLAVCSRGPALSNCRLASPRDRRRPAPLATVRPPLRPARPWPPG
jgi:hypothetical protein